MDEATKMRQCKRCPAVLPEDEFPLASSKGKLYRRAWCPACLNRYLRFERTERKDWPHRQRPRRRDLSQQAAGASKRPVSGELLAITPLLPPEACPRCYTVGQRRERLGCLTCGACGHSEPVGKG